MAPDATPSRGGLTSLYANLLGDSANSTPGTIASAPVTYKQPADVSPEQDEAAKKQQALAASLRFQPTKRPQLQAQKAKAKAIAAKFSQPPTTNPSSTGTTVREPEKTETSTAPQPSAPKTRLADWTGDDDAAEYYGGERRQRGGRKKRKKNRGMEEIPQNWDDIYDPSRPNNYEEYRNSDEKIREIREWKDRLYAHKIKRRTSTDSDSEGEYRRPMNKQFAPPPMTFAPPKVFDEDDSVPPPPPPADIPDDATGEDAYARRMRLSQAFQPASQPPPVEQTPTPPPGAPPAGQIARAPVRYNLPPPPPEIPSSEAELEAALASESPDQSGTSTPAGDDSDARSKRPGQAGFAERLMAKYGWTKGSGLGASGTGIINPLYAKVDKRKKKSDAEGGGFVTPAGRGKILGGQKDEKGKAEEEGLFGKMSEVVILKGMLRGLDLDEEMSREEGGIMQEIGEECGEKYGTVERVYIHRKENSEVEDDNDQGPPVFIKFTSQLSALKAVNALQGRIFGGNEITAKFWDKEDFDDGIYE